MKIAKNLFISLSIIALLFITSNKVIALYVPKEEKDISSANEKFIGNWNMQTIVTESNCPNVLIGTTTESNLRIEPIQDFEIRGNILKTFWEGGTWSKSSGTLKILNKNEAVSERITEFVTKDKNTWKSVLIDHLKLNDNNTIHLDSIVIQYKNNSLIGKYKTYSILTKSDSIAQKY